MGSLCRGQRTLCAPDYLHHPCWRALSSRKDVTLTVNFSESSIPERDILKAFLLRSGKRCALRTVHLRAAVAEYRAGLEAPD
ncbi:hypothetical protein NDU88_004196 [Pleurodeles waltl]|uniref:Uncharacterized protein n=1 Tax=Pleurodeles waltl TaxID=8319 RepID=A0AAV7UEN2_PLEWA|nr:hypothetical protein NDU88_004196 [Pleurodeles waltl]